jgi:copper chaperone CopZ
MENSIKHTFHIGGMSCGGCVTTVKNKLEKAAGVTSVKIDLAKKEAEITSTQALKSNTLQEMLVDTDYTISEEPNALDKNKENKQGGCCCG